jgi:hypothetical protein
MPLPRLPEWTPPERLRTAALYALLFGLAAASVMMLLDVFQVLRFEWMGAMDNDVLDYFHVARGLLNGHTLYADLYESKPIVIFLLTGLSLLFTGDERLLAVIQVLMYLSMPLAFVLFAREESLEAGFDRIRTILVCTIAGLIGTLLMLYLEERSGMMQTEGWGGYFGTLYMLSIAWRGTITQRRIIISTILLFLTIFTKEPFLLTALAAALLVTTSRKQFIHFFVVPLFLAGIADVLLMLFFGYMEAYFQIHIPTMLSGRVASSPLDPVWLRPLAMHWLYGNTTDFFLSAPLFGYLLLVCLGLFPVIKGGDRTLKGILLALIAAPAAFSFLMKSHKLVTVLNALAQGIEFDNQADFLLQLYLPWTGWFVATAGLLFWQYRCGYLGYTLIAFAGVLLASQAVGISVYTDNHFAFAVPFYATLIAFFIRYLTLEHRRALVWIPATLLLLFIAITYRPSDQHMKRLAEQSQYTGEKNRVLTQKVDALMDACNIERYYSFGLYRQLAFTSHSHMGPMVVLTYVNYLPADHYLIKKTLDNVFMNTPVMFVPAGATEYMNPSIDDAVRQYFTDLAPACAQEHLPIEGVQALWRKQG